MEAMAADTTTEVWTDERWTENLQQVFKVLAVVRGMKAPDIADAMAMPRSTFYDKLKKGTFAGVELAHAATALNVSPAVFYGPSEDLLREGHIRKITTSHLMPLPDVAGQLSLDDELDSFGMRPFLSTV